MERAGAANPQEAEAFEWLRLLVPAPTPPHVNPWALAANALLVADRLAQPDVLPRVEALGRAGVCAPGCVDDLRRAARSLMHALWQWGDASEGRGLRCDEQQVLEAEQLRLSAIQALNQLDDDDARLWLDVFRLPSDGVDLVYDLRAIALLYEEHAGLLAGFDARAGADAARRSADALERSLRGEQPVEEWGQWAARAFSLTLSLYLEVRSIGQTLRGPNGLALAFPSAAGIARSAARNRSTPSSKRPPRLASSPPRSLAPPGTRTPAVAAELQDIGPANAQPEAEPTPAPPDLAPAPLGLDSAPKFDTDSPPPESSGSRRRFDRLTAELEVSLLSDTNFYMGFTENLSEGGLFVATYLMRPLGSHLELCVRLPWRADPLVLRGIVRWVREYSPTSDGHPGMGIQFESLSERDKADIGAFLATREPLFFDD